MKYLFLSLISLNCFADFVILHNKHDATSRSFVANYAGSYKVIDFYDYSSEETKDFNKLNILISAFPSVVDTETKLVMANPSTLEEGFSKIKANDKYQVNKILNDMKFGQEIIAHIRLNSKKSNLTIAQMDDMENSLGVIIKRLNLGQIEEAKKLIEIISANEMTIPEILKSNIIGRLAKHLKD